MDKLWKKETARAEYVDLFASVQKSRLDDMMFEVLKMKQTRKNNQQSTEWRLKGNDEFKQSNWMEAIKCYNKSLCFAEIGTENVALAYSNRSACNFHMMLLDEVLVDIELAKNANLPDRLVLKLDKRKSESVKLISRLTRMMPFEPKLSYEADKNFPCMANVVEIKYNEEFGRHLVAKRDIPAGQIVLLENDILHIDDHILMCCSCSRPCRNCFACPNCPDAMFCSFDCMNDDQIHKLGCGSFLPQLGLTVRFLIKALLLAITSFSDVDHLMQFVEDALLENSETLPTSLRDLKSKYHFYFKLSKSAPLIVISLKEGYKVYKFAMLLPKVGSLFDSDRKKRFLMHLSMHHILIHNSNTFGSENSEDLAIVSSLMNHSCAPNVIINSPAFSVTGRPIKKGEQLFIDYCSSRNDIPSDANERKATLKSSWGFDCKCEKCGPTRTPIDRKLRELITSDPCYKYLVKNQRTDVVVCNQNESAIIQKMCIEFLNKYGRSAWSPEIELVFNAYAKHISNELRFV